MTRTDRTRMRTLPWVALALAIALITWLGFRLIDTHRALDDQRRWQAAMVAQIGSAVARDGVRATALTPEESSDALARIVAARDGTAAMIADFHDARGDAAPAGPKAPAPAASPSTPAAMPDVHAGITRLRRTHSTGSAAGDARIIERDSRAAWTGWK